MDNELLVKAKRILLTNAVAHHAFISQDDELSALCAAIIALADENDRLCDQVKILLMNQPVVISLGGKDEKKE